MFSYVGKIEIEKATIVVGPCDSISIQSGSYSSTTVSLISLNGLRGEIKTPIEDYDIEPIENLKFAVKAAARIAERRGVVGICCTGGCGRTGTATILLLMAYYGMSLKEALKKFYDARGCGPESENQKLLLAYAETLRRHGLSGDALIDTLEPLEAEIKINDKVVATNTSKIHIDDIEIDINLIDYIDDLIVEMVKSAKKVIVPLDIDIIKRIVGEVPQDVRQKIEYFKNLWSIWNEAYSAVSTFYSLSIATAAAQKTKKKGKKKKAKYTAYSIDSYDSFGFYDEIDL